MEGTELGAEDLDSASRTQPSHLPQLPPAQSGLEALLIQTQEDLWRWEGSRG